ncbi:hypothetical protein BME96_06585 [Virgibacillus halodenitrificans]|uniref:DUF3953 domain-containing protein n=1 Tax=Virgibacillus halodenitrificans TaxID=1482 RepID=A0AAC9IXD6_VIRHA|nr:hypothetical protein BME96_06585 [Virgibacillus halodenitrificans]
MNKFTKITLSLLLILLLCVLIFSLISAPQVVFYIAFFFLPVYALAGIIVAMFSIQKEKITIYKFFNILALIIFIACIVYLSMLDMN